jgi:membrane protease YdiL (CAAX protease family)
LEPRGPAPALDPDPAATPPPIPAVRPRSLPSWPGWFAVLLGGITLLAGLGGADLVASGQLPTADPQLFVYAIVAGAALFVGGLAYFAVRGIVRRRHLPLHRYRGPSVVLLLVLGVTVASLAAIPFVADVAAIFGGGGEPSVLGSLALLTSTQLGLLLVTFLFVALPQALAGAPPVDGGAPLRSLRLGLAYGALAWLASSALVVLLVLLLTAAGLQPPTQPAEEALAIVNPLVVVLAVVIVAPIAEEVFYRGVAYAAWMRERGRTFALVASSLLFAVSHLALPDATLAGFAAGVVLLIPFFGLGLGLGLVYQMTGSLLAVIVMHATINGISVGIAMLYRFEVIRLPT